jgi:hypothetical protein
MLVTRILGDCLGCGGKNCFGNVSVRADYVLRGCERCKYSTTVYLLEVRKKVVYLDQFFFSHAFRGCEKVFVNAAQRIQHLASLQLLVVPFSSIHEHETHQWRGYDGKNKVELMEFIKTTSRGHEFKHEYNVQKTQIMRAFQAFLDGGSPEFVLDKSDAIEGNIHGWDDYYRIDIGRYIGDIELQRDLKHKAVEGLVSIFESWRGSTNTFEQNVALEIQAMGKGYIDAYTTYLKRLASGDLSAIVDSPSISMVVPSMLYCFSKETQTEEQIKQTIRFFASKHFAQIPYQSLTARMYAVLQDMVRNGAYSNRDNALRKLSGFYYDVKHIATYAPYCDAFIMDRTMATLVGDSRVGLEDKYGVRVFSLTNWDELLAWLDSLEAEMTEEHKTALSAVYPS